MEDGKPEVVLDAVVGAFSARSVRAEPVPQTWNSEACAPFCTLFAVKDNCTYCSLDPDGNAIVTVLPVDGFHVYVAEDTSVVQVELFVLPRTERVCVRVDHAVAGGRSITTDVIG